jgi:hypothetical protein
MAVTLYLYDLGVAQYELMFTTFSPSIVFNLW